MRGLKRDDRPRRPALPDEVVVALIHILYAYRVPPKRQLHVLLYLSGWTYLEIGEALGVSWKTSKYHWNLFLRKDLKYTTSANAAMDLRIPVLRYLLGLPDCVDPPQSYRNDRRGQRINDSGHRPSEIVHTDWIA